MNQNIVDDWTAGVASARYAPLTGHVTLRGVTVLAMRDELARLRLELEAAKSCSERYRRLRDAPSVDVRIVGVGKRSGAGLDDAVDALPMFDRNEKTSDLRRVVSR